MRGLFRFACWVVLWWLWTGWFAMEKANQILLMLQCSVLFYSGCTFVCIERSPVGDLKKITTLSTPPFYPPACTPTLFFLIAYFPYLSLRGPLDRIHLLLFSQLARTHSPSGRSALTAWSTCGHFLAGLGWFLSLSPLCLREGLLVYIVAERGSLHSNQQL